MNDTPSITVQRPPGQHASPPAPLQPLSAGLRVLIIEDLPAAAEQLRALLVSWGLSPWVTHKSVGSVDLAHSYRPHVVLLDLGLPDLHGFDVARQLRSQAWGRTILIVAITGWGQEADRLLGKAAGIDHHLLKPVDEAALHQLLAGVVRGTDEGK